MKTTKTQKKTNERHKKIERKKKESFKCKEVVKIVRQIEKGMLSEGGYRNKAHYASIYL